MKLTIILSLISLVFIAGCQHQPQLTDSRDADANINLQQDITEAIAKKDFRLLSTSTRLPQFPGLDHSFYQEHKALCGANYISGTGDLKRRTDDPRIREQLMRYMKQYNVQMLAKCVEQKR